MQSNLLKITFAIFTLNSTAITAIPTGVPTLLYYSEHGDAQGSGQEPTGD